MVSPNLINHIAYLIRLSDITKLKINDSSFKTISLEKYEGRKAKDFNFTDD